MRRFGWLAVMAAVIACAGAPAAHADDLATCLQANGEPAIAACARALAAHRISAPELARLHNRRGLERDRKADYDGAIAEYAEALRLDPKFVAALANRALASTHKRDFDRAIAEATAAIALDPNYAYAYNNRGLAHNEKGEFDLAMADLDAAIRLDPKLTIAYVNRGNAYRGKRDYTRAIAEYSEAIRIDPNSATAFRNRGLTFGIKGDPDRAIADEDEAIRLDPKSSLAYRDRGVAYAANENLDRAIVDFNTSITLNPKYQLAYVDRGLAYAYKRDFVHALADADAAVALNPGSGSAHSFRSFTYKQSGDLDRALAEADEAVRLAPNYARAYANRGAIYRLKGDVGRALADLTEAIRLDPSTTVAYTDRGLAHEKQGDLELARRDFNAAVGQPVLRSISAKAAVETARARLAAIGVASPSLTVTPAPSGALAERRVALVIGNSGYRTVPTLPNARRDADAIADALRGVGFQSVTLEGDLTKDKMAEALRRFAHEAETADWAVIYYAGHGIEVAGTNYLIPVDARFESDRDVQYEAVPLDQALAAVEGAHKLRVILLDACRENPFARQMRRTVASRSIGRGLARIEPDGGTLVAYAAKHGEVALDGDGANSPFVTALVRRLATPGLEINKLFRLVRDDVLAATDRRQEPFVYGSLPGEDFFFSPPPAKNGP